VTGSLKQISVGKNDDIIWGVDSSDKVKKAKNIKFDKDGALTLEWQKVSGSLKQVAPNGTPYFFGMFFFGRLFLIRNFLT